MDAFGNARLVGTGRGNFSGVNAVDRSQRRQQALRAGVGAILPTEAAVEVALAGLQQLLETIRPAQRVAAFEQIHHGGRPQFVGAMNVAVIARGEQGEIAIRFGSLDELNGLLDKLGAGEN